MTSRRLWLLLSILAAPLVIAANLGCNQFYGLDETRLPVDNKLTCDCECKPTTPDPVVSLQVVASTDDAEQDGASMTLDSATLDLGPSQVGLRFANLAIPHRANILTASVRFTATADDMVTTDLKIFAEQSVAPATFSNTDNDLTGRIFGPALDWTNVPAWVDGQSTIAEQTPELKDMLQALVDLPDWTDTSSFALRFEGVSGHRRAISRQTAISRAALLEVRYTTGVEASLPICASEGVSRSGDQITAQGLVDECARLELTLEGLAAPCGYPQDCTCAPDVDKGASDSSVCNAPCDEVAVDATCSNFDPNAFERCIQDGGSIADCKHFVAATNARGRLAGLRAFGKRARLPCLREPQPLRGGGDLPHPSRRRGAGAGSGDVGHRRAPGEALSGRRLSRPPLLRPPDGADHVRGEVALRSDVHRLERHRPRARARRVRRRRDHATPRTASRAPATAAA